MKAVAAMSLNRVIGRDDKIPWHLPEDFKWFKRLTTGHFVLMGRKTFASLGKPLPNRTNVVVTRRPTRLAKDPQFIATFGRARVGHWKAHIGRPYQLVFDRLTHRDVWLVRSLPKLIAAFERTAMSREVFVIGGAQQPLSVGRMPQQVTRLIILRHRDLDGPSLESRLDAGDEALVEILMV